MHTVFGSTSWLPRALLVCCCRYTLSHWLYIAVVLKLSTFGVSLLLYTAGKIAKSMGNLAVEATSVVQCMRLYRALGDQTGVWVRFGGRRLRLVELEEMEDEEETLAAQDSSKEAGALQYLRNFKKIALCLKV